MKVTAFITIRLNSQRLQNKNILDLGGHPLSWYCCDHLLKCKNIDDIYIYCSEERIMDYVPQDSRLKFLQREKWLDGDQIRAQDTYTAFTNDVDADIYVAGLTTAPFVRPETYEKAVAKVLSGEYDSAFAARREQTFAWYKGKPLNYDPALIPRTQDLAPVYVETSGFFVFTSELWKEHKRRIGFKPYLCEVDEVEGIDIDTKEDFTMASRFVKEIGDI